MLHATRPPTVRAARTLTLAVTTLGVAICLFPLGAQAPAGELTLITAEARQPLETVSIQGGEAIALDDLAALFQFDIGEDTGERTLTVNTGGGPIVLTAGQPLASVNGQLVSLDAPAHRIGGRWFVPLDFLGSALARVHDQRLELRSRSRLLLVGEVRVPRVSAQYRPRAQSGRLTLQITPNTLHEVIEDNGRLLIRLDADAIDVVRSAVPRGNAVRAIELLEELPGFANRTRTVVRIASHPEWRIRQLDATGGRPGSGRTRGRGSAAGGTGEPGSGPRPERRGPRFPTSASPRRFAPSSSTRATAARMKARTDRKGPWRRTSR